MKGSTRVAMAVLLVGVAGLGWFRGGNAAPEPLVESAPAPRWWKGNTHTHTLWSDGDAAPEAAARWYHENGYHFLVLSDHNVLSVGEKWFPVQEGKRLTADRVAELQRDFGKDWVELRQLGDRQEMRLKTLTELREHFEEAGRFLFLQGEEITDSFEGKPVHVNGVNLEDLIKPQGGDSIADTMRRNIVAVQNQAEIRNRPMLAHVNHPNFGWAITAEDLASVPEERFFEVYNGHPSVNNEGNASRPGCERMWDVANAARLQKGLPLLYGLATDDAHHYHGRGAKRSNTGRGWVMVRCESLDADAIVQAMMGGDFYSSSGVALEDVRFDGRELEVRIAAEAGVRYRTVFLGTRRGVADATPGEVLAETDANPARYRLKGDEWYVRARIESTRAHPHGVFEGEVERAWTQPVQPRP